MPPRRDKRVKLPPSRPKTPAHTPTRGMPFDYLRRPRFIDLLITKTARRST
jgi:hypothetical protein